MNAKKQEPIEAAINVLKSNLDKVARVNEWAELMGYSSAKLFSRHFLKCFRQGPIKSLIQIRLISIF